METLAQFLDAVVALGPDREAIAHAPHDRVTARMTWRELRTASRLAAKKLVALGVGKGTRVGLLCPNHIDWLPFAFGAFRIGAVLVPFSTLWKREEIAYGLTHADVQVLVTVPGFLKHDYVAALGDIVPELAGSTPGRLRSPGAPYLRQVVLLRGDAPGCTRWADVPADVDDTLLDAIEAAVSPVDMGVIFFTSGTTSQAKAVVHRQSALTISARASGACLGVTPDDALWCHMPVFWAGGLVLGVLATMAGGGRVVLHEQVDAGSALALLETERCTIMAGWHMAGPLLDHPEWGTRKVFLKKGTGGNHALAPRLLGPGHLATGQYGMSETATCVACTRYDDPEPIRIGSFGRPLAHATITIVDPETGKPVAQGETGEILVKGETLMEGYYKVPTSQTFDAQGFFKTGDLGYFDEGGCLHFAVRLKDVIKTAGVNVAAVEVEDALAKHPVVKAAHVVGVPHASRGENIAAFVVLEPGQTVDEAALIAFCKEWLASYKVPRHVWVIGEGEVPRTGTGKVEKPALRERAVGLVG